jgi:uncharacterized protein YuzB (UPF0349 family)
MHHLTMLEDVSNSRSAKGCCAESYYAVVAQKVVMGTVVAQVRWLARRC